MSDLLPRRGGWGGNCAQGLSAPVLQVLSCSPCIDRNLCTTFSILKGLGIISFELEPVSLLRLESSLKEGYPTYDIDDNIEGRNKRAVHFKPLPNILELIEHLVGYKPDHSFLCITYKSLRNMLEGDG